MSNKTGRLIIISSPSGGGKDSVIRALLKIFSNSTRIVNTTSRPPRPGNIEGADYHFISREQFKKQIKNGDFLEYNLYAGNYYGTEKSKLEQLLKKYDLVFTQIEVNGKHNLDKKNIKSISIFLLPENLEILKKRIQKRGGLTSTIITDRLKTAKKEIAASIDYNYRVVNKDGKFEDTVKEVADIIRSILTKNDK